MMHEHGPKQVTVDTESIRFASRHEIMAYKSMDHDKRRDLLRDWQRRREGAQHVRLADEKDQIVQFSCQCNCKSAMPARTRVQ